MVELFEFEIARGTGFPFVSIEHGVFLPTAKFDHVLVENILNNRSYDPQCEGSRHEYLYEIVRLYPNRERVFHQVQKYFEEMTGSDYGEYQVFGFVSLMVKDGHYPRASFVDKFEGYWKIIDSPFSIGVEEILDLEHLDGVERVARMFGRRLSNGLEVDDLEVPFFEVHTAKNGFQINEIMESLKSSQDPLIKLYIDSIKPEKKEDKSKSEFSFDLLFERFLSGERFPTRRLVRKANDEQFARYCDSFIHLDDKKIKSRMLQGLGIRKFAGDIEVLVAEYRRSRNTDYRLSLLEAMVLFDNPVCRILGEELYDDKFRMVRTKILLTQFKLDDGWWILESLEKFSGHELHSEVTFFLEDERVSSVSIYGKVLEILLRRMECSICRNSVAEKMMGLKLLDRNQIAMLMRDCYGKTRKSAKEYNAELALQ